MPDILNTTATTSSLTANGANNAGTIEIAGDEDWWGIGLTLGTTYQFRLNGAGLADPYLSLMNPAGTMITANDDGGGGRNSLITYTATASGTYYLSARGYTSNIGDYLLSATSTASDAIVGTTATGSSVTVGGAAGTGTVDYGGDEDWWSVALTAGTTYQFQLNGTTLSDAYLRLLNPAGTTQITANDDGGGGTNARITYTATASGTYYLSAQGYSANTGTYSLTATSVANTDNIDGATTTSSSVIIDGVASTSSIDVAGDQDWFSVVLTAGTNYQFALAGVGLVDPNLRLLNSAGTLITADDDGGAGLNSLISYAPTASGTYYLSAQAFNNLTGTYSLTATSSLPAADSILATTGTTSVVTVGGGAVSDTINTAGDQDWWRVSLTAGTNYQFSLDGVGMNDPYLRLLDSSGVQVATNDDGGAGLNALISYTATNTGSYYLSAQGYANSIGTYSLTAVSINSTADIVGGLSTASTLTAGGAAGTSTIGIAGDQDWWSITLDADKNYRFTLDGTGLADPVLRLLDASGNEVKTDDDSGTGWNSLIDYAPTAAGTYYLSAESYGSDTGNYSLLATTTGTISDDTSTGGVLTVSGGAIESTIGIAGDKDWWSVTLDADANYRFTLDSNGLADPFLRLLNSAGVEITTDNDSGAGTNSLIDYVLPTVGGTYYLAAGDVGAGTGNYSVMAVSTAILRDNQMTTGALTIDGAAGVSAIGTAGDADWWRVELSASTNYRFTLDGTGLADSNLRLLNAAGTELSTNNGAGDGGVIEYTTTALTGGTYYVEAAGVAGTTGAYSLTAATFI